MLADQLLSHNTACRALANVPLYDLGDAYKVCQERQVTWPDERSSPRNKLPPVTPI